MSKIAIKKVTHASRWVVVGALCAAVLAGCSSSSEPDDPTQTTQADTSEPDNSIPTTQASAGEPLLDPTLPEVTNSASENVAPVVSSDTGSSVTDTNDPIVQAALPETGLVFDDPTDLDGVSPIVTLADTGLRIGFANGLSPDSVDANFIEASWVEMQSCLNVVAVSPLVVVSDGTISPTSGEDDVLFQIDGTIVATSIQFASGATIQIALADLDGSLNRVGFNLRSIMGRFLWLSANLPERDYPHSCASQG